VFRFQRIFSSEIFVVAIDTRATVRVPQVAEEIVSGNLQP
jgi:hypothetical protein